MTGDRVDKGDAANRPANSRTRPGPGALAGTRADGTADTSAHAPDRTSADVPGQSMSADAPARLSAETADRTPAAADGVESERRAIARRLHRALVDHTYGVARDAWAEALPDLRAAWENHKRRYPERWRPTPEARPDGSWMAGPDRRLYPEQNAEASKAYADIGDEGRRDILPALKRVESAEPGRRLAGLEHMLKGEDRLKEKIADELAAPGVSVREALAKVSDPVRYTFTYSPQRYADGVLTDVDRLKAEGFELFKLKNLWAGGQYKGVNSQWRRPETGLRFEVQFHTQESLEAKELTHGAYERIRGAVTPTERAELERFQRAANGFLVTPEDADNIKDYPEKK